MTNFKYKSGVTMGRVIRKHTLALLMAVGTTAVFSEKGSASDFDFEFNRRISENYEKTQEARKKLIERWNDFINYEGSLECYWNLVEYPINSLVENNVFQDKILKIIDHANNLNDIKLSKELNKKNIAHFKAQLWMDNLISHINYKTNEKIEAELEKERGKYDQCISNADNTIKTLMNPDVRGWFNYDQEDDAYEKLKGSNTLDELEHLCSIVLTYRLELYLTSVRRKSV